MEINFIFDILKNETQEIIDLLAVKENKLAKQKMDLLTTKIEDLMDHTTNKDFLREISKYQVLLEHLKNKLN